MHLATVDFRLLCKCLIQKKKKHKNEIHKRIKNRILWNARYSARCKINLT